jgi:4'-phosphopantetheinyl transferase
VEYAEPVEVPSLCRPALAASEWTPAPAFVDVWQVDLARVAPTRLDVLNTEVRARAARIDAHRGARAPAAFAPSRAALRKILSLYVDAAPAALEIDVGEHGRPQLSGGIGGGLDFNVSHTGSCALVAVAPERSVGVDVESLDASRDVHALSKRFFTEVECARIASDAGADNSAAARTFYRLWTCKEAYLKALGTGFSRSPRSFEVTLGAAVGPAVIRDVERVSGAAAVSLVEFDVGEGSAAAVAASLCVIGAPAPCRVFDAAGLLA